MSHLEIIPFPNPFSSFAFPNKTTMLISGKTAYLLQMPSNSKWVVNAADSISQQNKEKFRRSAWQRQIGGEIKG